MEGGSRHVCQVGCTFGEFSEVYLPDVNAVYTWGCNRYGQLGHGKIPVQLFPRHVTSLYGKKVIKVVCGKHHTIVCTGDLESIFFLMAVDKSECFSFGAGMCGQLGNRNKKHSFSPATVALPKMIKEISCGNLHSVALMEDGTLFGWGYISADQLGLSETGEEAWQDLIHDRGGILLHTNSTGYIKGQWTTHPCV